MKPSNHKEDVKKVLESHKDARVSDLWMIWHLLKEKGYDPDKMTVRELFRAMKGKDFPHFETIRRTRQKIQELHPHLKPHDTTEAETETKQDLRQGDLWYDNM